jgi:hypothetical protein
MTTIRIDRLEAVYEALRDAPPEFFELNSFRRHSPCGTVQCAVGHYISRNPECGLVFVSFCSGLDFIAPQHNLEDFGEPIRTCADHFGLSGPDVRWLFFRPFRRPVEHDHFTHAGTLRRLRNFIDAHKPAIPTMDFKTHDAIVLADLLIDAI